MSQPLLERPAHRRFLDDDVDVPSSAARTRRWRRISAVVSAGVFGSALVAGINLGLSGPAVSPVAPPASTVLTVPAAPTDDDAAPDGGRFNGAQRGDDRGVRTPGGRR